MKKTLVICGHYPLPENIGTNMRTMNFVRYFLQYGSVDLAFSHIPSDVQCGSPFFRNEIYLQRRYFQGKYKHYFLRLIKRIPLPVYYLTHDSSEFLRSHIISQDYDYILVRYVINTGPIMKLPLEYKNRTIIDFDDIISGNLYGFFVGTGKGIYKNILHRLNKKILTHYEKRCLKFGSVLFCSEHDRRKIGPLNHGSNMFVVPNIYYNDSFTNYDFGDGFRNNNILLFVGTLNYKPNYDGLKWFIENVFHDFRVKYPDARLIVVGRFPTKEVMNICNSVNGIKLHGDVADIREYYRQCRAVIVPILAAGGTRIKILEAALANRPILSTPVGAEGLDITEENILLFQNSTEFHLKYNSLLDRDRYNKLIMSTKLIVEKEYSIQKFNSQMEIILSNPQQNISSIH